MMPSSLAADSPIAPSNDSAVRTFGSPAEPLPEGFRPLRLLLYPTGLTLVLNRTNVLVGRHSEADVRLPLPDVSRHHCRLTFTQGAWRIEDLDSLNGVWVNGQRTTSAILRHADQVRVGGFSFEVHLDEPHSLPLPAPHDADEEPSDTCSDAQVLRSIVAALPTPEVTERRKAS